MTSLARYTRGIAILAILIGSAGYAYFQASTYLDGPRINIVSPTSGETVLTDMVTVSGTVKNASFISLDGRQIYTTEAGVVEEQLLVPLGYTIITLKARDRFGHTAE